MYLISLAIYFLIVSTPLEEVKGFTHCTKEGQWFITCSPTLKSCCKVEPQADEVLFLEVDTPLNEKRLYTFSGVVRREGEKRILKGDVVSKSEEGIFLLPILVGGVALLSIFSYFILKN